MFSNLNDTNEEMKKLRDLQIYVSRMQRIEELKKIRIRDAPRKIYEATYTFKNKTTCKFFTTKDKAIDYINEKDSEILGDDTNMVEKNGRRTLKNLKISFELNEYDLE